MPRRNLVLLMLMAVVSLVCYQGAQSNRYGRMLAHTLDHISRRYYEPVRDQALFEEAVKGMVRPLDENSAFIPAGPARQQFDETVTKEFGGVGMHVTLDPKSKQLIVLRPLIGAPAFEQGVRAGDRILRIDGRPVQGMSLDEAVALMHGKPGTSVAVTIQHPGETAPVELKLVRRIIQEDTVCGDTRNADGSWNYLVPGEDRIAYVRLTGFAESDRAPGGPKTTATDLRRVLESLRGRGLRGLVLDLRDNPGGSLDAAIETCDMFLPHRDDVIVSTRGRDGRILRTETASGVGPFVDFPVAVLVNQYSASAAEIVAACLQDHRRAVVVGCRTFGKGTVQEVVDLGEQCGELKLTVATYWRPSGRNIHRTRANEKDGAWGVLPDDGFRVPVSDAELGRWLAWRQDRDNAVGGTGTAGVASGTGSASVGALAEPFVDRPLMKALEYLRKKAG
jgi:carboxyl-terminal processing protease